jgi:hypothetical protein
LNVPTAVQGGGPNNSVESCTAACFASGYPLAGVEYSAECCTCYLSPHFSVLAHSPSSLKIAVLPSLMAGLRRLRVIATWPATETALRPVVAPTALTCTTTLAPTFRRLGMAAAAAAAVLPGRQFSLSFLVSRRDGRTMLVGCRLPLYMRDVQNFSKNGKYPGTMPTDASYRPSFRIAKRSLRRTAFLRAHPKTLRLPV